MIIDAINKIQNVGRFVNCNPAGLQFSDQTIIYGKNTQGKSTLVAILRSLKNGEPSIIEGKKTFGTTGQQKIEIRLKDDSGITMAIYPSKNWYSGRNTILIFDSDFIMENVFVGDKITYDNQSKLNEIIIGEKGKFLIGQISQLQAKLDSIKNEKRKLTLRFQELIPVHLRAIFDIEGFCSIVKLDNIAEEVEATTSELKILNGQGELVKRLKIHLKSFTQIDINKIQVVLKKIISFDPSSISAHINKHWNNPNASKEFLRIGLGLTKEDKKTCVFCGQPLHSNEIILLTEFENYFKGEYQSLRLEIQQLLTTIESWNPEKDFTQIKADLNQVGIDLDWKIENIDSVINLKSTLKSQINAKLENLYFVPPLDSYLKEYEAIDLIIQDIKKLISKYDVPDIQDQKRALAEKLSILELQQFRSKEELEIICDTYLKLNSESEELKNQRELIRAELEKYSGEIFDSYKSAINANLKELRADFTIEDVKSLKNIVGERERIFTLVFYDNFKIDISENNPTTPNFKNTFSESDRRLLAFSFFMALLQNDQELDKKILVFDDPFSSFDEERKRDTIKLLKDIRCDVRKSNGEIAKKYPLQKLIFTHERNFYREIYHREFPNAVTLKISTVTDGNTIKASKLERCNVDEDFPDDEIVATIKKLSEIKRSCDYSVNYESDCRIVMENILKRKYYFLLEEEILKRKSVRTFIIKLKDKYDEDDYINMIRLCDSLNIELHDNSLHNSNGDHDSILKDFFKYIEKL